MAVDTNVLEAVIRGALPVTHLEIEDQSNGCGENYAIILVSEVRRQWKFTILRPLTFCNK